MFNKRNNLFLEWPCVLIASASILGLLLFCGCKGNKVSNPPEILSNGDENSATAEVKLTWDKVSNANSYNIYCSEFPGITKDNGKKVLNVPNPPATVPDLSRGRTYYFVVTAENSYGESGESNEVSHYVR